MGRLSRQQIPFPESLIVWFIGGSVREKNKTTNCSLSDYKAFVRKPMEPRYGSVNKWGSKEISKTNLLHDSRLSTCGNSWHEVISLQK